jgi:hypothetical protein
MNPGLVAAHVHQALREGGMQIALIWPTPWPDRWHVGLTTTLRWATRDPMPGERVFDVLRAWGFELDQHASFRHWRWLGPPPRTNPMRQQMRRVCGLDRRVCRTIERRRVPIRVCWTSVSPPAARRPT